MDRSRQSVGSNQRQFPTDAPCINGSHAALKQKENQHAEHVLIVYKKAIKGYGD